MLRAASTDDGAVFGKENAIADVDQKGVAVLRGAVGFVSADSSTFFGAIAVAIKRRKCSPGARSFGRRGKDGDEFLEKPFRRIDRVIGRRVHAINKQFGRRLFIRRILTPRNGRQRQCQHEGEYRRHDANHNF